MDAAQAQAWLDRYVEAWQSYDPAAIGDLFSEDATYRYHPSDEGDAAVRGRQAIVDSWTGEGQRDEPDTYDAHYEPWAVDGERAVAVGWSRYWTDASRAQERATYNNVFLLEFDGDGRCRSFSEVYIERPKG